MSKDKEPTVENVFGIFDGGKGAPPATQEGIPSNMYEVTDVDGILHVQEGFLIFTAQHIAVMRDEGSGAIPVLVLPLNRLASAVLSDEIETD